MLRKLLHRYSSKFVSRWVILGIDLSITILAFLFAYFLRFNFNWSALAHQPITFHLVQITALYLAGFLLFRPFSGIIRHSSIQDLERILWANVFGIGTSLLIYTISPWLGVEKVLIIPQSILLIHFFIVTFLMTTMRFLIRTFYRNAIRKRTEQRKVLIYGAGQLGRMTRHALEQDPTKSFVVEAYLDDNPTIQHKRIEGIPVLQPEEIDAAYLANHHIQEVIIAIQRILPDRKREVINRFIDLEVPLKNIPPVHQWINGELSSGQLRPIDILDLLEREPIRLDNPAVARQLQHKVVLVTGAAGSIGSEIVRQVITYQPLQLILVDQAESPMHNLLMELQDAHPGKIDRVVALIGDVKNAGRMASIFEAYRPSVVYHAAAYKHVPLMESNVSEAVDVNILGTACIANLAGTHGVSQFVMISTDKAVNPTNVMGASKRMAELSVQCMQSKYPDTQFITTRFGNVLGSNGSVVPMFEKQIKRGGPVTVTHPHVTRYFMTIPEACSLVLEAGAMGKGGEIFVFDMGKPIRIAELARKMIRLSGLTEDEIPIRYIGLRPGEKLYEEVLSDMETTLETHHPKIRIAQQASQEHLNIQETLALMQQMVDEGDDLELVKQLKTILPEYNSANSPYTALDSKETILSPKQVSYK